MQRASVLTAAVLGALTASAGAAVITTDSVPQSNGPESQPETRWFSSQIQDHGPYAREAENISNDSFFSDELPGPDPSTSGHTSDPHNSMWLTKVPGVGGTDNDPFVIIDLGAEYTVTDFHVWNYNELGGDLANRGVRLVDILSSTGERTNNGDGPPVASSFALRQSFEFAKAPGQDNYMGEHHTFTQSFNARYIKLDINSNWGRDGYGLSEIQFSGTPVPEPASLGLLATAAIFGLRRRRQA